MQTRISLLLAGVFFLFVLGGCGGMGAGGQSFVREEVDLGYVNRVAVLPFVNNTEDKFAAEKVRDIASTQILVMELFDVVDKGVVDSAMREMAISADTPIDVPLAKRLGQRLEVQGFIIGAVNSLGENRQGSFGYSEASFTLQLLDSESALVLWRSSDSISGYSLADRLFGLGSMDTFQLTSKLLRQMLATIPK